MGIRRDHDSRHRILTVGCVAAGVLVLAQGVALAEPTADDVRERIEELEQEFSELNEAYNTAKEDHDAAQKRLEEIQEEIDEVEGGLADLRGSVQNLAQLTYTGNDPSSPMYLITTTGPEAVLEQAADLGYLSSSQQASLESYSEELEHLESLEEEAASTEEDAADDLERAEEAREEGEAAIEEQQDLLDELTEEERAEVSQETAPTNDGSSGGGASYTGSASGNARTALDFAYAQIGKPYIWGGTGPDGFDCSGLTQAAWRQAGVNLPRVSQDQFYAGTRVSWENLQPGDLLFFYDSSAPSHVGMYAGDGMMVHASNSSKPVHEVRLADYYQSHFVGAVRP